VKSKLFSFIVFYCLLIIAIDTSSNIYRMISFPVQLGSFKVKNKVSLLNFQSTSRIQFLSELFDFIRPNYLYDIIWPLPLFGYDHLFDRIIFKAVHFDTDGNRVEPYKYFNDNGSKADNLILNERFLLSCWKISDYLRHPSSTYRQRMSTEIKGIISHSQNYLPNKFQLEESIIYVKILNQPTNYKGNYKPWTEEDFLPFLKIKGEDISILNPIALYNVNGLNINDFKTKNIVRNPNI
jgi:hypothetical protein